MTDWKKEAQRIGADRGYHSTSFLVKEIEALAGRTWNEAIEKAAEQCVAMRSKTIPPEDFRLYDLAFQHAAGAVLSLKHKEPEKQI